ncbi:hypothetical protein YC2023_093389 [Brassica napus]
MDLRCPNRRRHKKHYPEVGFGIRRISELGEGSSQPRGTKLAYQYPTWMQIDDGDGSTLQFISDDHEEEVFVQMRRKIKEVNLFVTVSEPRVPYANVTDQNLARNENDDDSDEGEGFEDDWVDFAIGSFGGPPVCPIPHKQNGIVICEPIIRLASPTERESYREKGKAIDIGGDIVGWRADVIHPLMSTTKSGYGGNGESSRAVRRRLFEEPMHRGVEDVEMEESGRADWSQ